MESHRHSFHISRLHCEYISKHPSSLLLTLHMNDDYFDSVSCAIPFLTVDVSHATVLPRLIYVDIATTKHTRNHLLALRISTHSRI